MGYGRKRATRRPGGTAARVFGWLGATLLLGAALTGCPPTGEPRQAAVASPSPIVTPAPLPRALGRAFMAAARAHQALALEDPGAAGQALDDVAARLAEARAAAPPAARRRVLALEDRVLVAQTALAAGDPRGLAQARVATKGLVDALLADGDAVAVVPAGESSGGGGGGGAPGPAASAALPAWAEPALTETADGKALRAGKPVATPRASARPQARVAAARPDEGLRQGLARGIGSLAAAHRELVAGRPQAALPHVRQLRAELRQARRRADLAGLRLVAELDVQANQVEYQARKGSPLAAGEARRLLDACLAHQARLELAATGGGGGGAAAPKPQPTASPEDPTLAE